ncbi:glycosyltransferase [bacterium]|nr:glycosyltransferase [bacterium]
MTQNKKKISLCMIVKNEEEVLSRALESVKGLVDEMIIVDTGSTDNTKDIALSYGARVYDYVWDNNFSNARNYSLSKAEGEWILVLDADEALSVSSHSLIRELLDTTPNRYFKLIQTNYITDTSHIHFQFNSLAEEEAAGYIGYIEVPIVRLFKNSADIRYEGIIHEQIPVYKNMAGLADTSIRIHHYGFYKKTGISQKNDLYLTLALEKCEQEPSNWHHHYELGNQWWGLGNKEKALQAYEQAYSLNKNSVDVMLSLASLYYQNLDYKKSISLFLDIVKLEPTNSHIFTTFPTILFTAGFTQEALNICGQGQEILKGNPIYHFNRAVLLQNVGNFEDALHHYQSALYKKYRVEEVYLQSGMCHLKLGHYQEALQSLARVTSDVFKKEKLKVSAICHLTFGKVDLGINALNQAFLLDAQDPELCYFLGLAYFESGNAKGAHHYLLQCADDKRLSEGARQHCRQFLSVIQSRLGGMYE